MGAQCSTPQQEDVFTSRNHSLSLSNASNSSNVSTSSIDFQSAKYCEDFTVNSMSPDTPKVDDMEKMRVMKSKIILLIGDNRIKVATACYMKTVAATSGQEIEVVVGTRDPDAAKNSLLQRAGVRLIKADMTSPETLLRAIRDSKADTVFLISPNQVDRSTQTTTGITACKRAGVGHVVVLSSTCVERDGSSILGDQCKRIELSVKKSGLNYTIVRIPILMDNYLSQLQSMAEYGIFYRPLPPYTKRNAVTVADLGAAIGTILLSPGNYPDKVISLNGPLTDCETASEAFSVALGKTVIYEQASYDSYRETLLEAQMPEWQVSGILELFRMYERQEPFCIESTQELQTILGRPPHTVFDLAKAAVARTKPKLRDQSETKDGCSSGSEPYYAPLTLREESTYMYTYMPLTVCHEVFSRTLMGFERRHGSLHSLLHHHTSPIPFSYKTKLFYLLIIVGNSLTPYSGLNILRAVDIAPSSSFAPAGLAGLMKITLSIGSPHLPNSQKVESKCSESVEIRRSLEQRYCILLDGILTFLPPTAGTKGEGTAFLLECISDIDRFKWHTALAAHIEHMDSKAGSKWLY